MAFRKFSATQVFDGRQFLPAEQVVITTPEGVIEAIVPGSEAGDDVQEFPGIIAPGLINCHCHLELSHMRGRIPGKTGLVDFVYKIVTERHHSQGEIAQAIADAESEMIRNGIVAVGDICNTDLTLPTKQLNRLRYYNFIESSGWLPAVAEPRFKRALELWQQFNTLSSFTSIVPHAAYSVSAALWQYIQPYFRGKTVTIHNQETAFEDAFFQDGSGDFTRMYALMNIDNSHHQPPGKSSLSSYFSHLEGAGKRLLVHNTFTAAADIAMVQSTAPGDTFFCLCINANQYIEDAVPPVDLLRSAECNMVLGTDSLASNWSLSILDEMATIRRFFPHIPLQEMLAWATLNGAKALEMDHQLGSFEKGKQPGIVHFNENLSFIERLV